MGTVDVKLISEYPYNWFRLTSNGETIVDAQAAVYLQTVLKYPTSLDCLDLDVLYIGQSYGVNGARTAPERLKSHSTLQGIYAEAISMNPDSEIWLALASFEEIIITKFDGRTKFSESERAEDEVRMPIVLNKLFLEGLSEQQKINFTEAALIRYFQPKYNVIFKDNFPNPAHGSYSECYDLEINTICIELNTMEMIKCKMYSDVVKRAPRHMHTFTLHSSEDRKSMFDLDYNIKED